MKERMARYLKDFVIGESIYIDNHTTQILTLISAEIEKVELSEGEIHLALVESRRDPVKAYARYRAITRKVKQKILALLNTHDINKSKEGGKI